MILEYFIQRLEKDLGVKINGIYKRSEIQNIYKLTDDSYFPLINQTLFIQKSKNLKNEIELEEIPSLSESFILKTNDVDLLNNLYEQSIRILNYEQNLNREYTKLFNLIKDGKGLDSLVDRAHKFLKNPISICDSSFSIIASSPKVIDSKNLITTNNKQYLKDIKFQDMLDRNIIEHLMNSKESIITNIDDFNNKFLFQSIQIGNNTIGYICVRETVRSFNEEDLDYLRILAQMLAIELQKEILFQNAPNDSYESYFLDLIKGQYLRSNDIANKLINFKGRKTFYSIGLF